MLMVVLVGCHSNVTSVATVTVNITAPAAGANVEGNFDVINT